MLGLKVAKKPQNLLYYNYGLIQVILKFTLKQPLIFNWTCEQSIIGFVDCRSALTPPSPTTLHEDTLRAKHYFSGHINKTFNEDIYSASYCYLKLRVKMDSVYERGRRY